MSSASTSSAFSAPDRSGVERVSCAAALSRASISFVSCASPVSDIGCAAALSAGVLCPCAHAHSSKLQSTAHQHNFLPRSAVFRTIPIRDPSPHHPAVQGTLYHGNTTVLMNLFDVRHSTISYTAPSYPTYRTVPMSIASTFCAASTTGMHRSFLTKSGTSFKATST